MFKHISLLFEVITTQKKLWAQTSENKSSTVLRFCSILGGEHVYDVELSIIIKKWVIQTYADDKFLSGELFFFLFF